MNAAVLPLSLAMPVTRRFCLRLVEVQKAQQPVRGKSRSPLRRQSLSHRMEVNAAQRVVALGVSRGGIEAGPPRPLPPPPPPCAISAGRGPSFWRARIGRPAGKMAEFERAGPARL